MILRLFPYFKNKINGALINTLNINIKQVVSITPHLSSHGPIANVNPIPIRFLITKISTSASLAKLGVLSTEYVKQIPPEEDIENPRRAWPIPTETNQCAP